MDYGDFLQSDQPSSNHLIKLWQKCANVFLAIDYLDNQGQIFRQSEDFRRMEPT